MHRILHAVSRNVFTPMNAGPQMNNLWSVRSNVCSTFFHCLLQYILSTTVKIQPLGYTSCLIPQCLQFNIKARYLRTFDALYFWRFEWMRQGYTALLEHQTEPNFPDLWYTAHSVIGFHYIILNQEWFVNFKNIFEVC